MRPTESTLKRLFVQTGNRCAFPQCTAPLTVGETLVAEVCHIRGDKPGSARHDPTQTNEERQQYENLIVLCPTHHTVVDNDVESYTVERLLKMKADHEAQSAKMSGAELNHVVVGIIQDSFESSGQSGGIAAQNIHAHTLNVHQSSTVDVSLQARRIAAAEKFWTVIKALKNVFSPLVHADNLLTKDEIAENFERGWGKYFSNVEPFRSGHRVIELFDKTGAHAIESERLFVSRRAWSVFFIIRAFYGRVGYLFQDSYEKGQYRDWRDDASTEQMLRSMLPPDVVDRAKQATFGGMKYIHDYLEEQFIAETGMRS